MLYESLKIDWKRMVCYAKNVLADIAIERNDLDAAQRYLDEGVQIANYNRNRRRRAFYLKSFAYLEEKRGNYDEARRRAEGALALFGEVTMEKEREELKKHFNL